MDNWLSVCNTIERLFASYGSKFEEAFPFAPEVYECARDMVLNHRMKQILGSSGMSMILPTMPADVQDMLEILLDCDRPFFSFVADMLKLKRHLQQILGDLPSYRQMGDFGDYIKSLKEDVLKFGDSEEENSAAIAKLMFWKGISEESELASLRIAISKASIASIQFPKLDVTKCSMEIALLLIWLCSPLDEELPGQQLIIAFLYGNTRLTEIKSCMTTTDLIRRLLLAQLDVYLRVTICQHRLAKALGEVPEIVNFGMFDKTQPHERFVMLGRFAAILGYEGSDLFKSYVVEMDAAEYFRYNDLGTVDIVFSRARVEEYNWPLRLLGCITEQDIVENYHPLKQILEEVQAVQLKERIATLLEEFKGSPEYATLSFGSPDSSPELVVEEEETKSENHDSLQLPPIPELPDETIASALNDVTDQVNKLSFSIDGGWDLDDIN